MNKPERADVFRCRGWDVRTGARRSRVRLRWAGEAARPARLSAILGMSSHLGGEAVTESEIKAEMRLYALECVVCQMMASTLVQAAGPAALSALERQRSDTLVGAQEKTFPEFRDAAISDAASAELEAAAARLADLAKAYVENLLGAPKSRP